MSDGEKMFGMVCVVLFTVMLGMLTVGVRNYLLYDPHRQTQLCERAGVSRGCLRYSARPQDPYELGCYCVLRGRGKLVYPLESEE